MLDWVSHLTLCSLTRELTGRAESSIRLLLFLLIKPDSGQKD